MIVSCVPYSEPEQQDASSGMQTYAATASTSGETATYDAAGDMQCRAPTSATTCAGTTQTGARLDYDAERRLSHWQNAQSNLTTQAWYLYDGSGQRVEQYVSGGSDNHTYYLPGGVEEVTPSGSLVKYYAAGGMLLGVNTAHDASGISYLASDGLGSVSEALSPSGTATGAQLYSPYGGVRYSTGTMPTSKGFTGQYSDAASSGLDYYGARYYDPSLGQFTSADTANDGINRYGYVKGNPETATDPTGHRRACDHDCGTPAPPKTKPDCHTTHTCPGDKTDDKKSKPSCNGPCPNWGDVAGDTVKGLLKMGAAIGAMVLGCANGILEAISCEAAIDMATPWLLAGIRDLLKAASEIAEIFGAGFGSAMQVVLQALMVSIDAAEGFLNLLNLFTLGDVGASKLVDTANVLAEGVQTNVGLAKAGFNLVESSEGPVAYYRQQWQEFKQSSDRFFSVGNGIINTITMGILPDTFASDWENFQAAWQAWYDNGFPAS